MESEQHQQQVTAEPADEQIIETPVYIAPAGQSRFRQKIGAWYSHFREFIIECRRVLRVTKKPTTEEFKIIVKVSGIGMAIIGGIGFLVHFAAELMK